MQRRFIHCGAALALLTFSMLYAAEEPFVVLDSLRGKAEVQRAGRQQWVLIGKDAKLYNSDIVRVLDKSAAQLKWQNGTVVFVNANSQLLINIHADGAAGIATNYATVFFGAVYFIVKKTLPREVFRREDTRVYTPTAILAIRGTSFSVTVNRESGLTGIGVINGTVLVKNILGTRSLFLAAGYQTQVAMNTDPLVPEPLLEQDIAALKKWVPPPVIDAEMAGQIARAKADYATITGKLEEKVAVMPFINNSAYKGNWRIGGELARMVAENIIRRNRANCTMTAASDTIADPVLIGQKENARYVIAGEVTHFDIIQRAEVTAAADKYREMSIAKVCLRIQLVDAAEKKEIYKNDFCQEVSGKNTEANNWKRIGALKLDLNDKDFSSSILGKALNAALDQAVTHLSRTMGFDHAKEEKKE